MNCLCYFILLISLVLPPTILSQSVTELTRGTMFEKCKSVIVDQKFMNVTCKCGDTPTEFELTDLRMGQSSYKIPANIFSLDWTGCGESTSFFISLYSGDFALSSIRFLKIKNFGFLSFYRTADIKDLDHPLQEIYLEDGFIYELPEFAFHSMKNVRVMRFHNLTMRIIDSRAFNSISSISTLQFTKCSVREIRTDAFHRVGRIDYLLFRDSSISVIRSGSIVANPWELTPQKVCIIDEKTVKSSPVWEFRQNNIEQIETKGIAGRAIAKFVFEGNKLMDLKEKALAININNPSCTELSISISKNYFMTLESGAFSGLNTSFEGGIPGVTRHFYFAGNVLEVAKIKSMELPKDFILQDGSYNYFPCHCFYGGHEWLVPLASKVSSLPPQDQEFYATLFHEGYCYADRQKSDVLFQKWISYLEKKSPMDSVFIKKLTDKDQAMTCGYNVDDIPKPISPTTMVPPDRMTTFSTQTTPQSAKRSSAKSNSSNYFFIIPTVFISILNFKFNSLL